MPGLVSYGEKRAGKLGEHTECGESMVCFESREEVPLDCCLRKRRSMRNVVGHAITRQQESYST